DVARLDDGIGGLAGGESQLVGGLVGDRRGDGRAADVDLDVGGGRAFFYVDDLALELVACAELHDDLHVHDRSAVITHFPAPRNGATGTPSFVCRVKAAPQPNKRSAFGFRYH